MISITFHHGGQFTKDTSGLCYSSGSEFGIENIDPDKLSRMELVYMLEEKQIVSVKELWFKTDGMELKDGLHEIRSDQDILLLCDNVGSRRVVDVYAVKDDEISPHNLPKVQSKKPKRKSPSTSVPKKPLSITLKDSSASPSTRVKKKQQKAPSTSVPRKPPKKLHPQPVSSLQLVPYVPPRSVQAEKVVEPSEDDSSGSDDEVNGSDSSDLGSDYLPTPFDNSSDEDDEVFEQSVDNQVNDYGVTEEENFEDEDDVFNLRVEDDVYGVDSTGDEGCKKPRYPQFNHLVDFKAKIHLCSGMIFGSHEIFRKALRQFAIENGFDFYYLHNDVNRVSAYCVHKCKCPLVKNGRKLCIPGCKDKLCGFKAKGRIMKCDGSFQMKSFVAKHDCGWQHMNRKVTSVWLAEKYLEHYRDDPQWRIKAFIAAVQRDYNVVISYHKAWRARVRAMIKTQGYAPKQYAKIYDYAAEILKRNKGSSVFIKA